MGAHQIPNQPTQTDVDDAYYRGYSDGLRNAGERSDELLRNIKRVLWALAHEAGGSIRVSLSSVQLVPNESALGTSEDQTSCQLVITALEPGNPAQAAAWREYDGGPEK